MSTKPNIHRTTKLQCLPSPTYTGPQSSNIYQAQLKQDHKVQNLPCPTYTSKLSVNHAQHAQHSKALCLTRPTNTGPHNSMSIMPNLNRTTKFRIYQPSIHITAKLSVNHAQHIQHCKAQYLTDQHTQEHKAQ